MFYTTDKPLRYLRAVQAVLKSLGHDVKLNQHEYQLVMGSLWSTDAACECAANIIADRGKGAV